MSDLISRQAAIDALTALEEPAPTARHLSAIYDCEDAIKALPSAQPEIIRCKDCKYNTYSKKCLQPDSFFLVPADDFYCGYAERRTDG